MAIDFPNSPGLDQEFTSAGVTWKYDGEKWVSQSGASYWKRDGTTLKPANDGDTVTVGSAGGSGSGRPAGISLNSGNYIYASRASGPMWTGYLTGINNATSIINADGSAIFDGTVAAGGEWPGNSRTVIGPTGLGIIGSGTDGTVLSIYPSNGAGYTIRFQSSGSATFAGTVTAPGLFFNLEPDNPANFSTEGEYTGPTLNVKDRILNLISRLDALEANEVIDDAADTSLLQLLANASARLDSIESRLSALEGGN